MTALPPGTRRQLTPEFEADVCLVAEGCYPYVAGGVSTWIDWLMRNNPDTTFSVLAILPAEPKTSPKYERPPNLRALHHLCLDAPSVGPRGGWPQVAPAEMATLLEELFRTGASKDFLRLNQILNARGKPPSIDALLNSGPAWETMCGLYGSIPHTSFLDFFWAWRALAGGLFRALTYPLPRARIYHAVSTGYAGLVSARAAIETGRPSVITEHGIYSNERRIEILMADWIANSIENGLDLTDSRTDIRDLWALSFENFARIAYASSDEIIALYEANQVFQRALGAPAEKLKVIPNGVDVDKFAGIARIPHLRPTIAFIGRVTAIKDVQTFIDVASMLQKALPNLEALIIGPEEEEPEYASACRHQVELRGLSSTVTFTGAVDVKKYLGRVDVLVLTSISEALPLVILEAGAAGVPCVTTDVGACREILEGTDGDENARGGAVVPIGASEEMAVVIGSLLTDPEKRDRWGAALRQRVRSHYHSELIAGAYRSLYANALSSKQDEAA